MEVNQATGATTRTISAAKVSENPDIPAVYANPRTPASDQISNTTGTPGDLMTSQLERGLTVAFEDTVSRTRVFFISQQHANESWNNGTYLANAKYHQNNDGKAQSAGNQSWKDIRPLAKESYVTENRLVLLRRLREPTHKSASHCLVGSVRF
jgi:hypothetical protein